MYLYKHKVLILTVTSLDTLTMDSYSKIMFSFLSAQNIRLFFF